MTKLSPFHLAIPVKDLSESKNCHQAVEGSEWAFNLAADMGGMGFIEKNKALCMISVLINTNLINLSKGYNDRLFYDCGHLNNQGAKIFTNNLYNETKDKIMINSRTQNTVYN